MGEKPLDRQMARICAWLATHGWKAHVNRIDKKGKHHRVAILDKKTNTVVKVL